MSAAAEVTSTWQQAWAASAPEVRDSPLRATREEAFARFLALGFPTTRDEAWRFTSVAPIAQGAFRHAVPQVSADDRDRVGSIFGDGIPAPTTGARAVLVDGRAVSSLARGASQGRVRVESLRAALAQRPSLVLSHLARLASFDGHAFVALNTALFSDGILVHVAKGVVLEEPIHVLSVTGAGGDALATHPRVLVVLEDGAQAQVVETHAGSGAASFSNSVTEVVLGAGAVLDHCHVQRQPLSAFHVVSTAARLGRDASLTSHVISLGAKLSRHDLTIELAGEGSSCTLDGLSFLAGSQHADHRIFVDHAVPHCTSDQLYKGVFAGRSKGVFTGKVRVRAGAKGTVAHQQDRNLLLSADALVDTQPQLEIHDDDVRCTHGATIGQIDEDQVFYLRSRGLSDEDARRVLTRAFASEIVARVPIETLRTEIDRLLDERRDILAGEVP